MAEFFGRMKSLADEMASAGKKLEDDELASYILAGLDNEYNPVVSAIAARVEPISLGELFTQLISFEQRLDLQQAGGSSVNLAARDGRGTQDRGRGRGRWTRGRGGRNGGRQGASHGTSSGPSAERPVCQLCGKTDHTVIRCLKRFDTTFTGVPENKSASSATTSSYDIGTNWYSDTGATDHITGELEKLTMRDRYHGGDQVHTASGAGMKIKVVALRDRYHGGDQVHTASGAGMKIKQIGRSIEGQVSRW